MVAGKSRWTSYPSLALSALLTVLFVLTAARHVIGGDNAEFVTIANDGGVAHPPGYPLFVLWLRAFAWLPSESPAHAAAISTALTGGLALVALSHAARAWGATGAGAAMAVVFFGTTSLAVRLATAAEVFMPNAAIVATILYVAAPLGPTRGGRRTVVLAGLAGLALANHLSAVFVAPVGLWGAWQGVRESRHPLRWVGLSVLAMLVGLSPYVLLVADARRAPVDALAWGDSSSFAGVWHHFLRADYGTTSLGASQGSVSVLAHEWLLAKSLAEQTHVVILLAAVAGAFTLARRGGEHARAGWLLIASFVLAGPLFVLRFNVDPRALGHLVVERFYLLPLLFLSLLAGVGVSPLLDRLPSARIAKPGVIALALVGGGAFAFPGLANEHVPTVENYLRDTMAVAPARCILIGTGDHRVFGFAYVQRVLGERRDVAYVDAQLIRYAWYRARVASRLGLARATFDAVAADPRRLAAAALATGRPVLVTDLSLPTIVQAFPSYPFGTALRVLPPGTEPPSVPEVEQLNVALFEKLHGSPPAPRDSWAQGARSDYARTWTMLSEAYERGGDRDGAMRNAARAELFLAEVR